MSRDAMKLALEALEMSHELDDTGYADAKKYGLASDEDITEKLSTAITALREALAEQPCDMGQMCLNCQPRGPNGECPDKQPAQQEPVVCTVCQGQGRIYQGCGSWIHCSNCNATGKLYTSPPAQQKPVAWLIEFENGDQELHFEEQSVGETHTPLCKCQPAQRKPLSEEWIRSRCGQTWVFEAAKQWVRLTEAAHNIKENT